jgi:WD40 repeat protein
MDDESEGRGWGMIVLQGARGRVDFLQFSPDSRTLVAPYSGGVQLWDDLTTSGPPATLIGYPGFWFWSARFTPNGRKLLLGGSRGDLVLHDLLTGEAAVEATLETASAFGVYCDLTPDGRYIVDAQLTNPWELTSRLSCRRVADPESHVWSVGTPSSIYAPPLFLRGRKRFVTFEWQSRHLPARERPVYVTRDTRTGKVVSEVPGTGDGFHSPVLSPDRRLIAGRRGVWVGVLRADDLGAEPVKLRNDSRKEFTGLAFHPSGRFLAATSNDQTVKLYDTTTWSVAEAYTWGIGRLRSVAFSPDGMLAAAGGDGGKVVVWDVDL